MGDVSLNASMEAPMSLPHREHAELNVVLVQKFQILHAIWAPPCPDLEGVQAHLDVCWQKSVAAKKKTISRYHECVSGAKLMFGFLALKNRYQ